MLSKVSERSRKTSMVNCLGFGDWIDSPRKPPNLVWFADTTGNPLPVVISETVALVPEVIAALWRCSEASRMKFKISFARQK